MALNLFATNCKKRKLLLVTQFPGFVGKKKSFLDQLLYNIWALNTVYRYITTVRGIKFFHQTIH